MAPLANTRIIPPGWETHHAPVSEDAMTAACTITRAPAAGAFNETTRRTDYAAAAMVWSGPCRATPMASRATGSEPVVGDQPKALRVFEVELPISAPRILVGDFVTFTVATDQDMLGRTMRVTSYPGGSLVWDRNLLCQEIQPSGR